MTHSLHFEAAVFDLDGVITDTARVHAAAWKELIDAYLEVRSARTGGPFEPFHLDLDYRAYVDGKPRYQGLRSFLEARGIDIPFGSPEDGPETETVCGLANRKDALFSRVLEEQGADLIPGTVELVQELRARGARVAVASSSRNCRRILERAGISELFEARVDGATLVELGLAGKPDPDMFVEAARRVDAEPSKTVVFEDAVSGVQAGRSGAFGLVVGVALNNEVWMGLREEGADLLARTDRMTEITPDILDAWFSGQEHRLPSALSEWSDIVDTIGSRKPAPFLDYDGTLTPIVSPPDRAVLSERMREVVRRLAARYPTTIVSGRGRDDVEERVGLEELNYAGSHGFDILGKRDGDEQRVRHQVASELVPVIEAVTSRLRDELAPIQGASVEPKRVTVAVHYRRVAPEDLPVVEGSVDAAIRDHPGLIKAHGKKVFEIRPELDWDKGRAVLWLMETLGLDGPETVPLYVGDDTTDEDAFRAIEDQGLGILVSLVPRRTAATYHLQDSFEVEAFLSRLAEL